MKKWLCILLLAIASLLSLAQADIKPLPANKAFQLSAMAKDDQTVVIRFVIANSYYLYRNKIKITLAKPDSAILATPLIPPGEKKYNPTTGNYMALHGDLQFVLPVLSHQQAQLALRIHYQGCSSDGFCYPPMNKIISINLSDHFGQWTKPVAIDIPSQTNTKSTPHNDRISQILAKGNLAWIIAAFFGFGVLISLTPCVLPMIPILSSIIIGHSQHGQLSHLRSFLLSLAYVLGMALTYAIAGVVFGYLGSNIQTAMQVPWVIMVFTAVFVLLALSMFGYFSLQLPASWQTRLHKTSEHQKRGSYIGVALMGAISSLVLSPCVTPPLVGALGFISRSGNAVMGGFALFALGIGMGLPLLFIGATSAKLLPKAGPWMDTIKNLLGVMLLAVAILLVSRILPAWATMVLWTILSIGCAYALGAFQTADGLKQKLAKILGVVLFIYGIILLIALYQGNTNPLDPIQQAMTSNQQTNDPFIVITTPDQLKQQLLLAKQNQQAVMLDFYADWCISCKQMSAFTLKDKDVKQALSHFRLIKVDVSNNDRDSKTLQNQYRVIAPPTFIFIAPNGELLSDQTLIGEHNAKAFTQHLISVMQSLGS